MVSTATTARLDASVTTLPKSETPVRPRGFFLAFKAAADFVFAFLLLVLTLPLLLVAMVLIRLTSRGPAIYSQTRLGKHGQPFTIYKLRTMTHDAEKNGVSWSLPGDSRVTGVGRWLRKTHIDELPQLWNVLRGEMSLVGPRPERPEFVPQLEQAIPHYRKRLLLRPGVTGLAQVQLPPDSDLDSVRAKLAFDLHYVRHAGFWLDVRICCATFLRMLSVPFWLLGRLFRLPRRDKVESAYQAMCIRHVSVKASVNGSAHAAEAPVPALS